MLVLRKTPISLNARLIVERSLEIHSSPTYHKIRGASLLQRI
ncbi:hypothetical protein [Nostoc sp. UHCC 0302]